MVGEQWHVIQQEFEHEGTLVGARWEGHGDPSYTVNQKSWTMIVYGCRNRDTNTKTQAKLLVELDQ